MQLIYIRIQNFGDLKDFYIGSTKDYDLAPTSTIQKCNKQVWEQFAMALNIIYSLHKGKFSDKLLNHFINEWTVTICVRDPKGFEVGMTRTPGNIYKTIFLPKYRWPYNIKESISKVAPTFQEGIYRSRHDAQSDFHEWINSWKFQDTSIKLACAHCINWEEGETHMGGYIWEPVQSEDGFTLKYIGYKRKKYE